jgi:hypothetical protein
MLTNISPFARTDLHCSSALSQKPRFRPLNLPSSESPQDSSLVSPGPDLTESSKRYESPALEKFPAGEHCLDWTLRHIRDLSSTLQFIRRSSIRPEENVWYSDKVYYLQHCLLEIVHSPRCTPLDTAFSIAALIFCAICFRDINFRFRAVADAVPRIQNSLRDLQTDYFPFNDAQFATRTFWVLVFGGMAAEGKQDRPWFVEKLRISSEILGFRSWTTAKLVLEDVLWQSKLDEYGSRLWREVVDRTREAGLFAF